MNMIQCTGKKKTNDDFEKGWYKCIQAQFNEKSFGRSGTLKMYKLVLAQYDTCSMANKLHFVNKSQKAHE